MRRPRRTRNGDERTDPRYEELRKIIEQAIIKGEFPPGTRLEEQELADRYKVSRTPVRETLRLLASTGLVEMRARQGAIVATLTIPKQAVVAASLEIQRRGTRPIQQHLRCE